MVEPGAWGDGGPGVAVGDFELTGYVWAENIGWVSLSCENTSSCGTVDYGVTNDGSGNLSGYAWGENVGWISFSCENTGSCSTVEYGVITFGLDWVKENDPIKLKTAINENLYTSNELDDLNTTGLDIKAKKLIDVINKNGLKSVILTYKSLLKEIKSVDLTNYNYSQHLHIREIHEIC